MPLRALLEGREFLAPLMSEEEWIELKKTLSHEKLNVMLPCCNKPGFLRVSKLGTRHFVHKVKPDFNCNWKPETAEHLLAKAEIVRACKKAGYEVSTEVTGPDWRADVLATRKDIKVAFEVQLSAQSDEETKERNERYKRDGIRACWLMKKKVRISLTQSTLQRDTPTFRLDLNENKVFSVSVNERHHKLDDFIEALLSKKIKFCENLKSKEKQRLHIIFYEKECWKCKKKSHVYYIKNPYQSNCGQQLGCEFPMWSRGEYVFRPEVLETVREFLKTDDAAKLKVGEIKHRYSKTMSSSYLSFGCYWCDALFGDHFQSEDAWAAFCDNDSANVSLEKDVILKTPMIQKMSHWCFPEDGTFCCQ